jgi:nitrogen-specific signal transduction histidine kinase
VGLQALRAPTAAPITFKIKQPLSGIKNAIQITTKSLPANAAESSQVSKRHG